MYHPIDTYDNRLTPPYNSIMKDASLGAMMGATAAAAVQLKKADEKTRSNNPLGEILRAGVVSGLATAAASAVSQSMGHKNTVTTMAAMFATGTAMMYLLANGEK
jgi:hypothetical protein